MSMIQTLTKYGILSYNSSLATAIKLKHENILTVTMLFQLTKLSIAEVAYLMHYNTLLRDLTVSNNSVNTTSKVCLFIGKVGSKLKRTVSSYMFLPSSMKYSPVFQKMQWSAYRQHDNTLCILCFLKEDCWLTKMP